MFPRGEIFPEPRSSQSRGVFKRLTIDERKLFVLILGFASLTGMEFLYGFFAADVHAVAYSLQAALHVAALASSLGASTLVSHQPAKDECYSYGYDRAETLAAFTNCCIVLFEGCFTAAHNFMDAVLNWGWVHDAHVHHVSAARASRIALLRAFLHIIGLTLFAREARMALRRPEMTHSVCLNAHSENMAAVAVKLLASASCALVAHTSDVVAPLLGSVELPLSLLAASFLAYLALPPLVVNARILLLYLPVEVQPQLNKCLREVSFTEGVLEVVRWSFWPTAGGSDRLVGTVSVKVRSGADVAAVIRSIQSICLRLSGNLTVQVLREKPLDELLANRPSAPIL